MEPVKETPRNPASDPNPQAQSFFTRLLQKIRHFFRHIGSTLKRLKNSFLRALARFFVPRLAPYYHSLPDKTDQTPQDSTNQDPEHPNFVPISSTDDNFRPKLSETESDPCQTFPQTAQNSSEISKSNPNFAQNQPYGSNEKPEIFEVNPFTPSSLAEFLNVIKRTPYSVLSQRERQVIATAMSFAHTKVEDIMLPPQRITYVHDTELIGPLTLDRLYRSGHQHFPVLDSRNKIVGVIHTTSLNNLEIKESSRADEILDRKVYYLRADYTLTQALAAFLRTNCYFFLVVDRFERIVGMVTYQTFVKYLFGEIPTDDFERDSDRFAVAKRKL